MFLVWLSGRICLALCFSNCLLWCIITADAAVAAADVLLPPCRRKASPSCRWRHYAWLCSGTPPPRWRRSEASDGATAPQSGREMPPPRWRQSEAPDGAAPRSTSKGATTAMATVRGAWRRHWRRNRRAGRRRRSGDRQRRMTAVRRNRAQESRHAISKAPTQS